MKNIDKLKELVARFNDNIEEYKQTNYDESNTRADFIDKLFEFLDWDVYNNSGYSEDFREVVREDKVYIKGKPKSPDYSFRIGSQKQFFVEAKKPSVNIKEDSKPAFQLRRYAYTANLPISILTDFEEFAVYDTSIKPNENDKSSTARIFYCKFDQYENNWEFIFNTFSREAVLKGKLKQYAKSDTKRKGTQSVDKELLILIETWRNDLAKNIALRNKFLEIYQLNEAVQKIIDRIIFLRIAEDRNTEPYGHLQQLATTKDIYPTFAKLFDSANKKYNSGLFKPLSWLDNLIIDDKIFKNIVKDLYYPNPYEFSVLPIEILGHIYEQFLGKTIRLTDSHQAKIEEKPEVRKAGGVYYTPSYIVDYIVKETVGKMLDKASKKDLKDKNFKITILDPACGSGSFLVGAYKYLLNFYLNFWTDKANIQEALKNGKIYQVDKTTFRLTRNLKSSILLNNIYGVDIDSQAVEVTKLSLLLTLMDGEIVEADKQLFFKNNKDPLLPNLEENIKCGNSLIDSSFYQNQDLILFDEHQQRKINTFDWEKEFKNILKQTEKEKNAYHITWVTHNSRISERMINYKVPYKEGTWLNEEIEIQITKEIINIIKEDKLKVLAYNICGDHIHMLIVCDESELSDIVRKLKGKSSQRLKEYLEIPKEETFTLWAQKFSKTNIKNETQLSKTIEYINNNRLKHNLPYNKGLQPLVNNIKITIEQAFSNTDSSGGFDCIIGNPPYGAELSELERNFIKTRHKINITDTAAVFMKFSTEILSAKGLNSFIVPKPFVYASNWKQVQSTIINNLTDLIDCSKVWKEVKLEQVIYVYNNNLKSKTYNSLVRQNENIIKLGKINKKSFKDFGFILNGVNDNELQIAYKMKESKLFLNDVCTNQRGAPLQKFVVKDKTKFKVLGGKEINRYLFTNNIKGYLLEEGNINDKLTINKNSILVQRIVAHLTKPNDHIKIIGMSSKQLSNEDYFIVDTINQLTLNTNYDNYFLLSLINSKLVSWFSYLFIFGKAIRTVQFDNPTTSRIPIPNLDLSKKVDKENHDKLVVLVEQILETQKSLQNAESDSQKKFAQQRAEILDKQIDNIVYKLYNLTPDEIKIVEEI